MAMADREGRFTAVVLDRSITSTGQNNLATVILAFRLLTERVDDEWKDCSSEEMEIRGYFYLEKKDGSLNTFTIDTLKDALGWDGRDTTWFDEAQLPDVQVTLQNDTYQGKTRLKVQWLNPLDYEGTGGEIQKSTDSERAGIAARLNSKLRAMAGGTTVTPPSAPPTAPAGPTATQEEAWAAFEAARGPCSDENLSSEWFRIIAELTGKDSRALNGADWAKVKDEGPGRIVPF